MKKRIMAIGIAGTLLWPTFLPVSASVTSRIEQMTALLQTTAVLSNERVSLGGTVTVTAAQAAAGSTCRCRIIKKGADLMNNKNLQDNGIDNKKTITMNTNDCFVTIYFTQKHNEKIENIILENLLDTFEKRMNMQINSSPV